MSRRTTIASNSSRRCRWTISSAATTIHAWGELSAITCPECGGSLWEHDEEGLLRFKCHVGHAYSPDSLEVSQAQALEGALWAALRSLEERAELFRRLARRVGGDQRLEAKAEVVDEHAAVMRTLVTSFGSEPGTAGETPRTQG